MGNSLLTAFDLKSAGHFKIASKPGPAQVVGHPASVSTDCELWEPTLGIRRGAILLTKKGLDDRFNIFC